jgi:YD repeat-containing protein
LSFNRLAQPFVQSYKYDSLFRLTEARETSGAGASAPQTWKETFGYDRYGNRISHAKFDGTTQLASSNTTDPTIDPNTNRFSSGEGYTFDKNGNLRMTPRLGASPLMPITNKAKSSKTAILLPNTSLTAKANE